MVCTLLVLTLPGGDKTFRYALRRRVALYPFDAHTVSSTLVERVLYETIYVPVLNERPRLNRRAVEASKYEAHLPDHGGIVKCDMHGIRCSEGR